MKSVYTFALGVILSGLAQAEPVSSPSQHFLGKRPYAQVPAAKQLASEDNTQWQGAGLMTDRLPEAEDVQQAAPAHPKQMRLHFISKRPYGDLHRTE
jgi:hypothetical protein